MSAVPVVPISFMTAYVLMVAVLRAVYVRDSVTDRLINRTLGLAGGGSALMVLAAVFEAPLLARIGDVAGIFTAASLYGVARLMHRADPRGARRRQRRYDLVAAISAAVLLGAELAARMHWHPPAIPGEVSEFIDAIACLPLTVAGARLLHAGIREVRATRPGPLLRSAQLGLIGVAAFWIGYPAMVLIGWFRGVSPADPGRFWTLVAMGVVVVITSLLAIPLLRMLLVRLGWDQDSRDCRSLYPMWADLIAAVPQVALTPEDATRRPARRRYRMAVEIRDALLHLRRPGDDRLDEDTRARLLSAVAAVETELADVDDGPGHDRELRQVLSMAQRWPGARDRYLVPPNGRTPVPSSEGTGVRWDCA